MARTIDCRIFALLFLMMCCADCGPQLRADDRGLSRSRWDCAVANGAVNNERASFIIDTGADFTAIDSALLQHLGVALELHRTVNSPSGPVAIAFHGPVMISVGDLPGVSVRPAGHVMATLSPTGHVPFRGIIGLDVLQQGLVCISLDRVFLIRELPAEFSNSVPIRMTGHAMSIPRLGALFREPLQRPIELAIDTGMTSALRLDQETMTSLMASGQLARAGFQYTRDARGVHVQRGFVLRQVTVGNVCFRNIPVSSSASNAVGIDILRHLSLVLDFPKRQILIGKPPHDVVDTVPMNASGMHVAFDQNIALNVVAVRPESPAAEAKVEVGDIVVSLDGKQPVDLSIDEVQEILARNGHTIAITFRRGDELRTVDLPLRLAFEYPPNWEAMDAEQRAFEKFLEESEAKPKVEDNP